MSRWAVLLLVSGIWACSTPSPGSEEPNDPPPSPPGSVQSCPVPKAVKPLVMHAAFGALNDAEYVVGHASTTDRAYALSVMGSSRSVVGHASGVDRCAAPASFEPTCTGNDPEGHEPASTGGGCFRLGCAGADVALIDVFVPTDGAASPTARGTFAYAVEAPLGSGTIECAENPWRTYRVDLQDAENARVEAPIGGACTFIAPSGERIDLTHHGRIDAKKSSVTVEVTFTALGGVPMTIRLSHSAESAITGEAIVGGRVVMRAREVENAPPFVWEGDCAE